MRAGCIALVTLAGCSQVLGIEGLSARSDAAVAGDAASDSGPDAPIPPMIRLEGLTQIENPSPAPIGGVIVEYLSLADAVVAQTTSGIDAKFSFAVPSQGGALDGYLRATTTDNRTVVTVQYFAQPVTADTARIVVRTVEGAVLSQLANLCGSDTANTGVAVASIRDATDAPVIGAMVTTLPLGKYCALDGGFPKQTNVSGSNGDVFAFEVPDGRTTIDVVSSKGLPLPSRTARTRANQLTIMPFVE
jgi:hypothetical protein